MRQGRVMLEFVFSILAALRVFVCSRSDTAELSARTFCTFPREFSSRQRTRPIVLEELSGVNKRPMMRSMPPTTRPQQRYDHRLRHFVYSTGDVTLATNLGVPRSTARGW